LPFPLNTFALDVVRQIRCSAISRKLPRTRPSRLLCDEIRLSNINPCTTCSKEPYIQIVDPFSRTPKLPLLANLSTKASANSSFFHRPENLPPIERSHLMECHLSRVLRVPRSIFVVPRNPNSTTRNFTNTSQKPIFPSSR
jgi:hypothetical protein